MKNLSTKEIEDIKVLEYCADYQFFALWSDVDAAYSDIKNNVWDTLEISVANHDTAQIKKHLKRAEQLEVVGRRLADTWSKTTKHRGINCLPQFKILLQILEKIYNL